MGAAALKEGNGDIALVVPLLVLFGLPRVGDCKELTKG
jgi:hypothetical protein